MEKILISSCLLGKKVRYDGNALSISDTIFQQWQVQGRVISVCPEVDAGMCIPRSPAEIIHGDGRTVWTSNALVNDNKGNDVTISFNNGAKIPLLLCQMHHIKVAVLTEHSPSCGSSSIYDGTFTGKKNVGVGVTVALIQKHGVKVFSQHNIEGANAELQRYSLVG